MIKHGGELAGSTMFERCSRNRRVAAVVLTLSLAVAASGCGSDKPKQTASVTSVTDAGLRSTTTSTIAVRSGSVPTAASCPTSDELAAIFKTAPSQALSPRLSSSGIACEWVWDPDPKAIVQIAAFRFDSQAAIEKTFADGRKRDENVAAGRDHSGEPGTITDVTGVADAAYVQMETPPNGAQQPPDYTLRARVGTLLIKVHVDDHSGSRFGPTSGNQQLAIDLGELLITKVG